MKQKIEAVLLPLLTGTLGFILSPFFRGLWDWCANVGLPALTKTQKLSLVTGLGMLSFVLGFALYRASSKRLLIRKYEFQINRGYWKHRKTNQLVCGSCLIAGIESPLAIFSNESVRPGFFNNSWRCGRKDCGIEGTVENANSPFDI